MLPAKSRSALLRHTITCLWARGEKSGSKRVLPRTGANCLSAWHPSLPADRRALTGAGQPPSGRAWAAPHLRLPPSRHWAWHGPGPGAGRASVLPVAAALSLLIFFAPRHMNPVAGAQQPPGALRQQTGVITTLCLPMPCRRPCACGHGRSSVRSRRWWASKHAPSWQSCVLLFPLCLGATAVPSDASSCVKPLWGLKEWK